MHLKCEQSAATEKMYICDVIGSLLICPEVKRSGQALTKGFYDPAQSVVSYFEEVSNSLSDFIA